VGYVNVLYLAILMEKLNKTMKRLEQLVARPSFELGTSRMQASSINVALFCLRKKVTLACLKQLACHIPGCLFLSSDFFSRP
jgi:hypothetical protein